MNSGAAGPTLRVLHWQPPALTLLAASLYLVIGQRAGAPLRLSIAGAAAAAAAGFILDDPAEVTLAASPTSVPTRRWHRVALVAVVMITWWLTAAIVASALAEGFPLRGRALELSALVAIALAVSALASRVGDGTAGSIAGAVVSIGAYAITYLPLPTWVPFPGRPETPGTSLRWLVVLGISLVILAWSSRDPARAPRHRHLGPHARPSTTGRRQRVAGRPRRPA